MDDSPTRVASKRSRRNHSRAIVAMAAMGGLSMSIVSGRAGAEPPAPTQPGSTAIASASSSENALVAPSTNASAPPQTPSAAAMTRSIPGLSRGWFDLTVGTVHGYPAQLVGKYNDNTELLPTTSALFMLEYAVFSRLRWVASYDLITTTERKIVSGTFVEQPLPSRIATGLALVPLYFDFAKDSRVEFQGYGLVGMTIEHAPRVFPILMGRVHLMQDRTKGVGVYLGTEYHFVLDKMSVLYGVGYRF